MALNATPGPNAPVETANGTIIRAETVFTRSDGSTGALGELIFETDRVQSRYTGDRGVASWAPSYDAAPSVAGVQSRSVNAKGYGRLTDLAVAVKVDKVDIKVRVIVTMAGKRVSAANDNHKRVWGAGGRWRSSMPVMVKYSNVQKKLAA